MLGSRSIGKAKKSQHKTIQLGIILELLDIIPAMETFNKAAGDNSLNKVAGASKVQAIMVDGGSSHQIKEAGDSKVVATTVVGANSQLSKQIGANKVETIIVVGASSQQTKEAGEARAAGDD